MSGNCGDSAPTAPTLTKNVVRRGGPRRSPKRSRSVRRRKVVLPDGRRVYIRDLDQIAPYVGHFIQATACLAGADLQYRGELTRLLPGQDGDAGKGAGIEILRPRPTGGRATIADTVILPLRYLTNLVEV